MHDRLLVEVKLLAGVEILLWEVNLEFDCEQKKKKCL